MSGNNGYIAPNGESIFQRGEIATLTAKANTIEQSLNAKVDITKYQGKINLLEANDLRHDADIAYLEANKLDKTTFDAKINTLLAKDATHDARLATLDALKASKVNISDYQAAIAGLTGVDAAFDHRLDELEARHAELDTELTQEVQNIVQNYVLNTTYEQAVQALQNTDSALAAAILTKADLVVAEQIQAGLTGIAGDKVSKTEFATDKAALEALNLNWERRLAAVDQYIRAMIETYEIKKPGTTGAFEYTAAFQGNWDMKEDHFSIIGRQPGGEIVLEMPEFAYNTFYGDVKMFLNSSTPANTKVKVDVSNTTPRRLIMDAGFASTVDFNASTHFPISITMYDSAGVAIKTKSLTLVAYQALPIITGAAFTYAKTSFSLVKGSSVSDNTLNLSPIAYGGSNLTGATWAVATGALPSGVSLNASTGAITGYPDSSATLGSSTATISSTKASHVNSLVLSFNVVAPHTISYTPNASYTRNVDMTTLTVNMTNSASPNNVFNFSVTDPDAGLTADELAAGMFTKGVYITKVTDAISGRVAGTIWGNPKNVGTRTYTVNATGLNGVVAATTVQLAIVNVAPSFDYDHVIATNGATWANYVHVVRENDVVVYLPNIDALSGEIKGADYPVASGGPKDNYEISPALPEGSNLVFDAATGKIYTPAVAPVEGVAQEQGVLAPFDATTFTITAYGPGGSGTATFKLQCLGPIPSFSYNPLSMEFVKGVAGVQYGPTGVAGVASTNGYTLYNLAGSTGASLPSALSFDVDTGVVSGTAETVFATTGYSVRAVGTNGTSLAMPFYLTVKDAIPAFEYDAALNVFVKGQTGTAFGPTGLAGSGAINFYALFNDAATPEPSVLPAGLNFNNSNGVVSGKAIVSNHDVPVTYNVKAYGPGGESVFKTFELQVDETAPVIAYNTTARVYTVDNAITSFGPTSTQHHIGSWAATGLPAGLSINSSTGVISGTPTTRTDGAVSVDIQATGDGGVSNVVTLSIEVNYQTPVFSYSAGVKNVLLDAAITPIAPAVSVTADQGSASLTWSSSPALPSGLSIGSDGTISGTPTVLGGPVEYTITADNGDNSSTAKVTINVDTDVAGSSDLTVEIGDADYNAKYLAPVSSNNDVVFIQKATAGNTVDASLVYENASGVLVEIAKKTLISGDFVSFAIDRVTQHTENLTQKLYVFSTFTAGTSVVGDAVARIAFVPAEPVV